jgi:hypothetical protein
MLEIHKQNVDQIKVMLVKSLMYNLFILEISILNIFLIMEWAFISFL